MISRSRLLWAPRAEFPANPDRGVAVSRWGAVATDLGVIGILTIVATTVGACGGGAGGSAPAMVWPSDATKAVVEDMGGGFGAQPPAGSDCGSGVGSYTFTVADDTLAWHVCDTAQTPFKYADGSRVVNAGERLMLVDALDAVAISTKNYCGADKSTRLLTVTRPSGPVTYRDSFYACLNQGIYVDGIDTVFSVANELAK